MLSILKRYEWHKQQKKTSKSFLSPLCSYLNFIQTEQIFLIIAFLYLTVICVCRENARSKCNIQKNVSELNKVCGCRECNHCEEFLRKVEGALNVMEYALNIGACWPTTVNFFDEYPPYRISSTVSVVFC